MKLPRSGFEHVTKMHPFGGAPLVIISDFLSFYLVSFCFLVFSFVLRICAKVVRSLQLIQLLG